MSAKFTFFLIAVVVAVTVFLSTRKISDEYSDLESQSVRAPAATRPTNETSEDTAEFPASVDQKSRINIQDPAEPVQIQSIYDDVFGRPEPGNPLSELHFEFKDEPRDESWASAMESGISQQIAKSGTGDWATVENIECRSKICEVQGFMPDTMEHPELDPHVLLTDGFGTGWWQGGMNIMTRQHTFDGEGITRFMLIIVRIDEEKWGPPE
jgi:hypothetical protein